MQSESTQTSLRLTEGISQDPRRAEADVERCDGSEALSGVARDVTEVEIGRPDRPEGLQAGEAHLHETGEFSDQGQLRPERRKRLASISRS